MCKGSLLSRSLFLQGTKTENIIRIRVSNRYLMLLLEMLTAGLAPWTVIVCSINTKVVFCMNSVFKCLSIGINAWNFALLTQTQRREVAVSLLSAFLVLTSEQAPTLAFSNTPLWKPCSKQNWNVNTHAHLHFLHRSDHQWMETVQN